MNSQSQSQNHHFGSLFQFIPTFDVSQNCSKINLSEVTKQRSNIKIRTNTNVKLKSKSLFENSINQLSEIVQSKNRRLKEERQKEERYQMEKTKQRFRTSEVSKRFTRMNGFFAQQSNRKQSIGYQKQRQRQRQRQRDKIKQIETDKIDKKHGLLRAIIKTKYQDNKYNQPNFYNQSFNRLQKGFEEIKLKQVLNVKDDDIEFKEIDVAQKIINLMKNNVPVEFNNETSCLSSRTRIRLEKCKNWAVRHKRKSEYYTNKLSLSSAKNQVSKDTGKERGKIMNSIRSFIK